MNGCLTPSIFGVVIDGQRLFLYSGYGMFGEMPGSILLGYEVTP